LIAGTVLIKLLLIMARQELKFTIVTEKFKKGGLFRGVRIGGQRTE